MSIPEPQIIRGHRQSISMQITRDGKFVVKAPFFVPKFVIQKFIDSKRDWIQKSYDKVSRHLPKIKSYEEGGEFWYLGLPRKLKFHLETEIIVSENCLYFPKAAKFRLRKELENWYIKKAREIISKRVSIKAAEMHAEYQSLMFSDTSSKWGTCTHDNRLQFNWRLVMAPLMVLDYVVIHELSHTFEKNHSREFWKLVGRFTPAYKQHRKWLNSNINLLTF